AAQWGDPVNLVSGNNIRREEDIQLFARGFSLAFVRTYNSRSGYSGPLGLGWTHNFNQFLTFDATGTATWQDDDGTLIPFAFANGVFTGPKWKFVTLTQTGTQSGNPIYKIENKDKTYQLFERQGNTAKLVSRWDRNGNSLSLVYEGALLKQVLDF